MGTNWPQSTTGMPSMKEPASYLPVADHREAIYEEIALLQQLQGLHLTALRTVSEALGHPYAGAGRTVMDLAALAAKAIKAGVAAGFDVEANK